MLQHIPLFRRLQEIDEVMERGYQLLNLLNRESQMIEIKTMKKLMQKIGILVIQKVMQNGLNQE